MKQDRFAAMRDDAEADHEGFWAGAAQEIGWFEPPQRTLESDPPVHRWFIGGRTNIAFNALDAHVNQGHGDRIALIALSERGDERKVSYAALLDDVEAIAAALRSRGIGPRDVVTIFMPTCVEAIAAMLAIVRVGAVHSVVFAGFGHTALADRIRASRSRVVLTADATFRRGAPVALKSIVDRAVDEGGLAVESVIVLRRGILDVELRSRDSTWEEFLAAGVASDGTWESMESNDPAFILATSGTTARPKLAVHSHGGYQVHIAAMARWCYGLRPDDVWWSTSDIGWIVGHSYIVYAPLIIGATTVAFEGAPDFPGPEAFWQRIQALRVSGLFTSPTAVRGLMRYGDRPARGADLSRVERVFCAGEVLNAPVWDWLQNDVFDGRIPVIDNMWQTETGGPIFGNPYGLGLLPIKPGSPGPALPGIAAAVTDENGNNLAAGETGVMVLTKPFPGLIASLWEEPERYARDYWQHIPGVYYTGDRAKFDQDGYAWFGGRVDEVIKTAGHRIGTVEVETALLRHPSVAEAGVVGQPDELRGEVVAAFVALRDGGDPTDKLRSELRACVRDHVGPLVIIGRITFVQGLPKTRSGKIMRRVLKSIVLAQDPGDLSTIEDEGSVEDARAALARLKSVER